MKLRFEQDRTWMMLGMAIRMATDLNLHRKSVPCDYDTEEGRARDLEVSHFSSSTSIFSSFPLDFYSALDLSFRLAPEFSHP